MSEIDGMRITVSCVCGEKFQVAVQATWCEQLDPTCPSCGAMSSKLQADLVKHVGTVLGSITERH